MPLKLRYIRMEKDDLAWENSDKDVDNWERSLHNAETYRAVAHLITRYRPGVPMELHRPIQGGYNIAFRLQYKDGSSALMRIPRKGIVKFPEEKVSYEVATMRYVAANTTIPVPRIYHHGTGAENPTGLGPFIIMDYIDHERTLSDALNDPLLPPNEPHTLNANISESELRLLYGQMANILLQLSTLSFPQIGSLVQGSHGLTSASGRPLIQNMNSLVEFAGVPPELLPSQPYTTSKQWYSALADMHMLQAALQRNDAILDEDDARDKFVSRRLFQRLAMSGQFDTGDGHEDDAGFRLYSEDLRPSNVLIDENLRVVAVVDWEFAYAAPAQFSLDPPWWLLLKSPEYWPGGYASWMEAYEPRLNTFLSVLEDEEKKNTGGSISACPSLVPLSQQMRRRWDDQSWLINYAARNSWAFDFIFWRFIDPSSYGHNELGDHRARLDMLSEREVATMEGFVKLKMRELESRALVLPEKRDDAAVAMASKLID
ncbi:Protein kinase-like domain [Cordyceps militaris CM01]|uniref:Protein kinase-like domain n=1 Tax=Cordyceps militaris (strain CM01) TaxID=983644 RepID=G3JV20_CORMM|nr:Protein kinase-like domain [Cordyceps militaris CM01]EGX87696.1 Protein kinase-like domain [Cordyceps militaris CM01]